MKTSSYTRMVFKSKGGVDLKKIKLEVIEICLGLLRKN